MSDPTRLPKLRPWHFDRAAFVPADVRSWDDVLLDILWPLGLAPAEPSPAAPSPEAAPR